MSHSDTSENDTEQRLEVLLGMLEGEGFMPEFDDKGESLSVIACNCPFREVAKQARLSCKLEGMDADFY